MSARCPHDGGTCHHECKTLCMRVKFGYRLTKPWPGYPKPGHAPQLAVRHVFVVAEDDEANCRHCDNGKTELIHCEPEEVAE
jgi:hypothetical protein